MVTAPAPVAHELDLLEASLAQVVPPRRERNLLVGTWNLRAFGDVSPTWSATDRDSPKRDWHAVACIATVLRHLDIVAVQEVRRSTAALRLLLEDLGPDWRVIASDVTEGDAGNGERLCFLYDSSRVTPSGLVGEVVLPPATTAPHQFARTPYAVSFTRAQVELILTTVHVLWGTGTQRLPEVTAFAAWMRAWADRHDDWNSNLLVLGDFNLDRIGDPLYEAFVSTGLWPPAELSAIPRTIFDGPATQHFYDQIAWFSTPTGVSTLDGLTYTHRAGSFDFVPHVFAGLSRTQLSWRVSDHYPLWVEFEV